MKNIRQFLGRVRLTPKEANIVRGICRQFLWHQDRYSSGGKGDSEEP